MYSVLAEPLSPGAVSILPQATGVFSSQHTHRSSVQCPSQVSEPLGTSLASLEGLCQWQSDTQAFSEEIQGNTTGPVALTGHSPSEPPVLL